MPRYQSLSDLAAEVIENEYNDISVNSDDSVTSQASSSELPFMLNLASEMDCDVHYVANTGVHDNGNEYTVTFADR